VLTQHVSTAEMLRVRAESGGVDKPAPQQLGFDGKALTDETVIKIEWIETEENNNRIG
jgi:hypothetical protein